MLKLACQDVVQSLCDKLLQSEDVYLCTVISTWGSSPRPPGAIMVWSEKGGTGSISGGCVEQDLFERFISGEFKHKTPCIIRYGDGSETGKKVRLPCGGIMQVLVERVCCESLSTWQRISSQLKLRQGLVRVVDLITGQWAYENAKPMPVIHEKTKLKHYLGPSRKLLIVGANQVSYYLANFTRSLDFLVTVCDPGERVTTDFQDGEVEFIARYPDGIVDQGFSDANSAVVAVSHDPRLDDMALMEALPSQAFYVGAMGSKRTSEARRERLRQLEVPEAALLRLHAPIGIAIGSKTPSEIAVSIAAHLVEQYARSH